MSQYKASLSKWLDVVVEFLRINEDGFKAKRLKEIINDKVIRVSVPPNTEEDVFMNALKSDDRIISYNTRFFHNS